MGCDQGKMRGKRCETDKKKVRHENSGALRY